MSWAVVLCFPVRLRSWLRQALRQTLEAYAFVFEQSGSVSAISVMCCCYWPFCVGAPGRTMKDEHAEIFGELVASLLGLRFRRCAWYFLPPVNMVAMLSSDDAKASACRDRLKQPYEDYEQLKAIERPPLRVRQYIARYPCSMLSVQQILLGGAGLRLGPPPREGPSGLAQPVFGPHGHTNRGGMQQLAK